MGKPCLLRSGEKSLKDESPGFEFCLTYLFVTSVRAWSIPAAKQRCIGLSPSHRLRIMNREIEKETF